ncbi:MAG: DUF4397 domain-containing protein, partial [Halanaeroarchaeum sp.]
MREPDTSYKSDTSKLVAVSLALVMLGSIVVAGGYVAPSHLAAGNAPAESQETTYLRVVHASPDAPQVDVYLDGEPLATNVSVRNATEYTSVTAGVHNLTLTVAGSPDEVVFDGNVTVPARRAATVYASGEAYRFARTDFQPVVLEDDALATDENTS